MSTVTVGSALPPLRRLPVPLSQPRPALRVVRDEPDSVPVAQAALVLPLGGPESPPALPAGPPAEDDRPSDEDDRPSSGHDRPAVAVVEAGKDRAGRRRQARTVTAPALPEPRQWAAQFVQAAVEVTTGLRPPSQLIRWVSDDVRGLLVRRASLTREPARTREPDRTRRPRRSVVRSIRVCVPRDGVAEACVLITDGERVRAVALRMEANGDRWRVTALRIG